MAAALPALTAGAECIRDEIGAATVAVDLTLTADRQVIPNGSEAEALRVAVAADVSAVVEVEVYACGMDLSVLVLP